MSFIADGTVFESIQEGRPNSDISPLNVAKQLTNQLYDHVSNIDNSLTVSEILHQLGEMAPVQQHDIDLEKLEITLDPTNNDPLINKETFQNLITNWLHSFVSTADSEANKMTETGKSSNPVDPTREFSGNATDHDALFETNLQLEKIRKESETVKLKLENCLISMDKKEVLVSNLTEKLRAQEVHYSNQKKDYEKMQDNLILELQTAQASYFQLEEQMKQISVLNKEHIEELLDKISNHEKLQEKFDHCTRERNHYKCILQQQCERVSTLKEAEEISQEKLSSVEEQNQELKWKVYELDEAYNLIKAEKKQLKEEIAVCNNQLLKMKNQDLLHRLALSRNFIDSTDVEDQTCDCIIVPAYSSTPLKTLSLQTELLRADHIMELSSITAEDVDNIDQSDQKMLVTQGNLSQGTMFPAVSNIDISGIIINEVAEASSKVQVVETCRMGPDQRSQDLYLKTLCTEEINAREAERKLFRKEKDFPTARSLPIINNCHSDRPVMIFHCPASSLPCLTFTADLPIYNTIVQSFQLQKSTDNPKLSNKTYTCFTSSRGTRGNHRSINFGSSVLCDYSGNVNFQSIESVNEKSLCHHNCSESVVAKQIDNSAFTQNHQVLTDNVTNTCSLVDLKVQSVQTTFCCEKQVSAQTEKDMSVVTGESQFQIGFCMQPPAQINKCLGLKHKYAQCGNTTSIASTQTSIDLFSQSTQTYYECVVSNQVHVSTQDEGQLGAHAQVSYITDTSEFSSELVTEHSAVMLDAGIQVTVDVTTCATQTAQCDPCIFNNLNVKRNSISNVVLQCIIQFMVLIILFVLTIVLIVAIIVNVLDRDTVMDIFSACGATYKGPRPV